VFELPELYTWEFPIIERKEGTKLKIVQHEGGENMETGGPIKEIEIVGNSDGLKYLAAYLLSVSLHGDDHVHLESGDELDLDSENVTIRQLNSRRLEIINNEDIRKEEIRAIQEYHDRVDKGLEIESTQKVKIKLIEKE